MKVGITLLTGEVVEIDDLTAADVGTLVAQLRGDPPKPSVKPSAKKAKKTAQRPADGKPLTPIQLELWQYLVDHDSSSGSFVSEMTGHFQVAYATLNSRMASLVNKGLAHRTSNGGFRPGEAPAPVPAAEPQTDDNQ